MINRHFVRDKFTVARTYGVHIVDTADQQALVHTGLAHMRFAPETGIITNMLVSPLYPHTVLYPAQLARGRIRRYVSRTHAGDIGKHHGATKNLSWVRQTARLSGNAIKTRR